MKTENAVLRQHAREALKNKWGLVIGACVVSFLIICGIQVIPVAGSIAGLIITGPMMFGLCYFWLMIARNKEATFNQIFSGFKVFGTTLAAYLLMVLFIILWSLLLIVPGIIAALSYSMMFFILADDESSSIGPMEALKKSKQMMNGNKWKLFCLSFSFFGWGLLCILTVGIGFLWLIPYINVSFANFYDDIKNNVPDYQPVAVS